MILYYSSSFTYLLLKSKNHGFMHNLENPGKYIKKTSQDGCREKSQYEIIEMLTHKIFHLIKNIDEIG